MADKKISQLTELTSADPAIDVLPIVDSDLNQTKKIKLADLPLSDAEKGSLMPFTSDEGYINAVRTRNITSIAEGDYQNTNVNSIYIGSNVTSIGDYAFFGCGNLTSVIIPDNVTSIGSQAFYNCYGLTSITIPNNVTSIGSYAFDYCTSLTSVTLPNNVNFTSIGFSAFSRCNSLTSIIIPDSVSSIGSYAFGYSTILESATLPNNVDFTSIEDSLFINTSLASITIPSSVTSIGSQAFYNCASLATINCLATTAPALGYSAFSGVAASTIHVPVGATYPATYGGLTVFFDL